MTKKFFILILAIPISSGCLDLDIKDEIHWIDTDSANASEQNDNSEKAESPSNSETDSDSKPIPDASDTSGPTNTPLDCGGGTMTDNYICVAKGSINASIRFQTDEAARIVDISFSPPATGKALSAEWVLQHWVGIASIPENAEIDTSIEVEDINGNRTSHNASIVGGSAIPVAITEVLADPLGLEPSQEFVEIFNFGDKEIEVGGWMIDDNGDKNGDCLPNQAVLPPGRAALIVGPNFDVESTLDPKPAPDTQILRLEGSIGSSGLKNTAVESIELYDAEGHLISAYSGSVGKPVEGVSVERIFAEIPDGDPLAFGLNPLSASSPGRVASLTSQQI